MAKYSEASLEKLQTCHDDLQAIFKAVIRRFDNTVIYGHRSPEFQFGLFKKGRKEVSPGVWEIVDRSKVVTNADGYQKQSDHNLFPSKAIDAAPYPVDLTDLSRIRYFAGYAMGVAAELKHSGKITHSLRWGGDWDDDTDLKDQSFNDLLHFYLV